MTGGSAGDVAGALPDEAYAAALAALPGCGPARLAAVVSCTPSFAAAWASVLQGRALLHEPRAPAVAAMWSRAARATDVAATWRKLVDEGVRVLVRGGEGYPAALLDDPEPSVVLFASGAAGRAAADVIDGAAARVAVVGTRRCTGYGTDVARALGRGLAASGVAVVSGLAAGIDAAAHEGALAAARPPDGSAQPVGASSVAASPVAVVGSGLDVVYPRRNRRLWAEVATRGVVLSEAPLGAPPEPWRFPLRNRIIAALADVVVVVESHAHGGSMHTVQAAIDRGVPVMAVPGSVRSPSSAGTNRLIAEGVPPAIDVDDVLVALSLRSRPCPAEPVSDRDPHPRPQLDPVATVILDALDWEPTTTEDVLRRTDVSLGAAAAALNRLEMAGLARSRSGTWERTGNHE